MTKEEQDICLALGRARYLPGSFDKRFANNVSSIARTDPDKELTEKQREWIYRLLFKYRKQLDVTYSRYKDHPLCSQKEPRKPVIKKTPLDL